MGVIEQIKRDVAFLNNLIAGLRGDNVTVTSNGKRLTGVELEQSLEKARQSNLREKNRLQLILDSGVIPEKYKSPITKDTYYPSSEEREKQQEKLPRAKYTFFSTKESRKKSDYKRSNFKVRYDDSCLKLNFFIQHEGNKNYPAGGFADRVKKGYLEEDSTEPKFAIKIYHKNMFNKDTMHELRLAMRAAYCYQQLGRTGIAFRRKDKQYLMTEWLMGAQLNQANEDEITAMPIARRIVMAISLLRELNILHKQGLIHNDIKPSNVIIDYGRLGFVDLDSVRPKNEYPLHGDSPIYTEEYLPTPQMSFDGTYQPDKLYLAFNECTDLYALGLTLTNVFREIYQAVPTEKIFEVEGSESPYIFSTFKVIHGPGYKDHPDLQKLLKQMIFQEDSCLITTDAFINAFQDVLLTYPDHEKYLSEDRLRHLDKEFSPTTGEKAFREIEIELLGYNQRAAQVCRM